MPGRQPRLIIYVTIPLRPPQPSTTPNLATRAQATAAIKDLQHFIGASQRHAAASACRGEKKQFLFDKVVELVGITATIFQRTRESNYMVTALEPRGRLWIKRRERRVSLNMDWKMILAETIPTRFNAPVIKGMTHESIISREQSVQILKNDLRKAALEQHADELKNATPERRQEIIVRIDRSVQEELRRRSMRVDPAALLY
jgi:hypothetical protein